MYLANKNPRELLKIQMEIELTYLKYIALVKNLSGGMVEKPIQNISKKIIVPHSLKKSFSIYEIPLF